MELVYNLSELEEVITQITANFQDRILLLNGEMGAGKTTFSKEFLSSYGIEKSKIQSPTYSIINHYQNEKNEDFYHLDLFRLENSEDLVQIGFQDILTQDFKLMLIEWPEIAIPFLDENYLKFNFSKVVSITDSEEIRKIEIEEIKI